MKYALVSALVCGTLLAGCGGKSAQTPTAIEIGAAMPLTGRFAAGGAEIERGYKLAVDQINAEGGIFVEAFNAKLPLNLNILDDGSDPGKTVSHLEAHFSDNDVVAYLGGFGSDLHAAAAAIAEKNRVPYLGVAFALWGIHQQGYRYLFSPFYKSPDIGENVYRFLNEAIPEDQRPTRVGIFQEQTDWGIEMGRLWRDNAPGYGYEVVLYEVYAPFAQDFTDLILKAQEAKVEVLFALPNPPDGVTIYKQLGELGFTPDFSFIVRAPDVPTWPQSLNRIGDFVTFAPGWHNRLTFPGVDGLNAAHQSLMGRPADPLVGPAYAAVQVLANAIERAGSLDRSAIREAVAATDLDTVIGHVTFRQDGTGVVESPILQYQNGNVEIVWPSKFATADLVYPAPPFQGR